MFINFRGYKSFNLYIVKMYVRVTEKVLRKIICVLIIVIETLKPIYDALSNMNLKLR